MSLEQIVNGGALAVLAAFVASVMKWLVSRLDRCEQRQSDLEERLMGGTHDHG